MSGKVIAGSHSRQGIDSAEQNIVTKRLSKGWQGALACRAYSHDRRMFLHCSHVPQHASSLFPCILDDRSRKLQSLIGLRALLRLLRYEKLPDETDDGTIVQQDAGLCSVKGIHADCQICMQLCYKACALPREDREVDISYMGRISKSGRAEPCNLICMQVHQGEFFPGACTLAAGL